MDEFALNVKNEINSVLLCGTQMQCSPALTWQQWKWKKKLDGSQTVLSLFSNLEILFKKGELL